MEDKFTYNKTPPDINDIRNNLRYDPDEPMFKQLRQIGQALKIPVPEAFLSIEVLKNGRRQPIPDGQGHMVSVLHQRSRSWTRNAYNWLFCQLSAGPAKDATFGAGLLSSKSTAGSIFGNGTGILAFTYYSSSGSAISYLGAGTGYLASAGIATSGIVIGSGANPESFEDYILQTLILNGTGAGQMSYVASEAHTISYDSGSKTLTDALQRYFNNNSGNPIGVNEVALYGVSSAGSGTCCLSRDALLATVTIPNAGQLKVTYTLSLVYPA